MSAARKLELDENLVTADVTPESSQLQRARARMTGIMAVVVLGLGFAISFDMIQPPAGMDISKGSATQIRNPASVQSNDSNLAEQAVDVPTNCELGMDIVVPAFVNQVRLVGSACGPRSTFEHSEINNVTNGYAATVYYPTPATFTTDYISLSKDENLIHITHFMKKTGREVREVRVRRR